MGNVSKCVHLFSMFCKMPMYRDTNRIAICQTNIRCYRHRKGFLNLWKHRLSNRSQCFKNCKGCFFPICENYPMYSRCSLICAQLSSIFSPAVIFGYLPDQLTAAAAVFQFGKFATFLFGLISTDRVSEVSPAEDQRQPGACRDCHGRGSGPVQLFNEVSQSGNCKI